MLLGVAAFAGGSATCCAATVFYDDFEDGSVTDGNPVSWESPAWVPNGQYRVENGDLILTASDVAPSEPGYNRDRTEMDILVEGLNIGELSLRTRFRSLTPRTAGTPYYVGVSVRDTLTRDNVIGSLVSAYLGSDGNLGLGYVRDTTPTAGGGLAVNYPLVSTGLDFYEQDVHFQLDVVGRRAKLWAWGENQSKPALPQFNVALGTNLATSGTVALWVFPTARDWNKPFAFREVELVAIPEPAAASLGLLASGGALLHSRKRRPSIR